MVKSDVFVSSSVQQFWKKRHSEPFLSAAISPACRSLSAKLDQWCPSGYVTNMAKMILACMWHSQQLQWWFVVLHRLLLVTLKQMSRLKWTPDHISKTGWMWNLHISHTTQVESCAWETVWGTTEEHSSYKGASWVKSLKKCSDPAHKACPIAQQVHTHGRTSMNLAVLFPFWKQPLVLPHCTLLDGLFQIDVAVADAMCSVSLHFMPIRHAVRKLYAPVAWNGSSCGLTTLYKVFYDLTCPAERKLMINWDSLASRQEMMRGW